MTIDLILVPSHLASCDAAELGRAVEQATTWCSRESPKRCAAVISGMAANPHLTFDQFVEVLECALADQLSFHDVPGGSRLSEAEFQIPVTAPGERAADWWLRLALEPDLVAAPADSPLGRLHRSWLMRRAFATNGPEQWPAMWRSMLGWQQAGVRSEFLAFALRCGLPDERAKVMDLSEDEIEGLTKAWTQYDAARFRGVPTAVRRVVAEEELGSVVGHLGADRAEAAGSLRRSILDSAIAGELEVDYNGIPLWMALFDEADRAEFLALPDSCRKESIETWLDGSRWRRPAAEAYVTALETFPLLEATARPHLTCKAPRHRYAIVVNPSCPVPVALEAIRRGIKETDVLLTSGKLFETDGWVLIETWWGVLMAVRCWFPAHDLSAALQTVTRWMLAAERRLPWFWRLAVTASRPDGIVGMDPGQYAAYESWLDDLAERPWTRTERADLTSRRVQDYGAATSPQMLRRLVYATGGGKSPLLVQPYITTTLSDLTSDLRVHAARKAYDDVLRMLVDDPDRRVRQHVARNRNASGDTLARLAADPDPTVRAQVARNAAVTAHCLTTLAVDPVPRVAQAAGQALLRKLAQVA